MKKVLIGSLVLLAALALTACGSSSSAPGGSQSSSSSSSLGSDFTVSSSSKTVHLKLVDAGGFNYDGKKAGAMVVTVPEGWTVDVSFTNHGQLRHSAAVVSGPNTKTVAFPGASTPDPTTGDAPGTTKSFSFTASKAGTYRIACLVDGHEPAGMWATLKIVSGGKPSIQ